MRSTEGGGKNSQLYKMIQPLFLGLGTTEIIVILVVVLLLFGGKKIPELMRGAGKGQHPHVSALRGEHFAGAQETKKVSGHPLCHSPFYAYCQLITSYQACSEKLKHPAWSRLPSWLFRWS